MTNKTKELFTNIIKFFREDGIVNPVEMIVPLVYALNQPQYQKLRGHIESCERWDMIYSNISEGYHDGVLNVTFSFASSKSKTYSFTFSSALKGNYCKDKAEPNPEWWNPNVNTVVLESVGFATWNGDKKELKKYADELSKMCKDESEIIKLKQEIAEKQQKLAEMTKAS